MCWEKFTKMAQAAALQLELRYVVSHFLKERLFESKIYLAMLFGAANNKRVGKKNLTKVLFCEFLGYI